MLPGISGSLVAGAFLESVVLEEFHVDRPAAATIRGLHRWWRRVDRTLGPASSPRAIADVAALPLFELLGFRAVRLEPHAGGLAGTLAASERTVALLTCGWNADMDAVWRDAVRSGRTGGSRWAFVHSGRALRIVDAGRSWSRRALEIDFARALPHERSAVAVLALLRAAAAADERSALEHLVERSDAHGTRVCTSLGDGVLDAIGALLTALANTRRGRTNAAGDREPFEQAVTIVYRLLFLLFAEARALVPVWHYVYREAYTIEALCRRATERPARRGLWKALQAISRLAHAGCRAGDLIVTPFNGRLFSPRHAPVVERARVADDVVARAVTSLATRQGRHVRERIAYADLDVEQLGAVYERVLEYEPAPYGRSVQLARTSHERKATGSFYTPRAMTDFLVRRALHPLVQGRTSDEILALRVVDPAMGSGAFLVSACRYLAGALERALCAEGRMEGTPSRAERAALRRLVVQRCLYGVDLNPMAVQLARLSLWLMTLSADRPLSFLDHHLMAGDSLLGAWIADLRRPPGTRKRTTALRPTLPLFTEDPAGEFARRVLPSRLRLARLPDDTPAIVRDKERELTALAAPGAPLARWKDAADLWCAGWFWQEPGLSPGVYADVLASLVGGGRTLPMREVDTVAESARAIARSRRFLHWELEFPEVFFDADGRRAPDGGFDAVIGNPPWDVIRADTGDRHARDRSRGEQAALLRYTRDAGTYRLQGGGHANRYQLFIERALQLARPGGRLGLLVPSGLATDQGSAALRRALFDHAKVDRLIGFDNRQAIFPIHREVRFLLLTATTGASSDRLTCVFGRSDPAWLERLPDAAAEDPPEARTIVLTRSLLESWDPAHLVIPLLPSREDLDILALASAAVPRLGDAHGWGARFGRELNATDDRPHFVARTRTDKASNDLVAIVEGKHIAPFRVAVDAATHAVPRQQVAARVALRRRLAYRDVASATNRLTLIAAVLPPHVVSTHTLFCLKTPLDDEAQYCLCGLLNSLAANYLVRLQVTTHVTTSLMARLPVPRPPTGSRAFTTLARLARSLERSGMDGDPEAYIRLNSLTASLYGLGHTQYRHVVHSFPLLPEELRAAMVGRHQRDAEARKRGNTESG